jgi:hypothetical protein
MTVNYPDFNVQPSRFDSAVEQLGRLQTELMSDVLKRAVDDAGAAMKHQLSEPLTALLLYLHEIKRAEEADVVRSIPAGLSEIVDRALCEIERVCNIIERVSDAKEFTAMPRARTSSCWISTCPKWMGVRFSPISRKTTT